MNLSRPLDSWDIAKCIGMVLMFCDHSAVFFFTDSSSVYWLRAVGRGAAPIFLFLAGYAKSYRFSLEIALLAVFLSMSDAFETRHLNYQNILYTILISRGIFQWFERRRRVIARPYLWYAGALGCIFTMLVLDYGSLGFLFALSGYLFRHREHYAKTLPNRFLLLSLMTYAVISLVLTEIEISAVLLLITLACVYGVLLAVQMGTLDALCWPKRLGVLLRYTSRFSAYIYVLHIAVLEWITHIPLDPNPLY